MIRYSPIGLVVAFIFVVFGPHNWFLASDRAQHTQVAQSALSSVLPDASTIGDQPRRGQIDAVETKQGYVVRVESGIRLRYDIIVGILLLLFAWPIRKMARKRRQDASDLADESANAARD